MNFQKTEAPLMIGIANQAKEILADVPYLNIIADDVLCSNVVITGSFDREGTWTYGILENSRYFKFLLWPANRQRYFNPADTKIRVELAQSGSKLSSKFRTYTGTPHKCLEKIRIWVNGEKNK